MQFDTVHQYNFPTTIRFGAGASGELALYLKKHHLKRPLVVTDATIAGLDFFTRLVEDARHKGASPVVFSNLHKNPVKSDVYRGTDVYDNEHCDSIIGIGGGAALDVARAITLRVYHREDLFKYDDLAGGDVHITNDVPHFIALPTTAGTGSEVGRSAIIADDVSHQKKILFSPKLMAKIVFADPALTLHLPPAITAATGMDALTHNMEAFLARMPHPICEGIALEGMRLVSSSIVKCVQNPDMEARAQLLLGSIMGAIAFQKGLGVVHSLAHPLSAVYDTHHGLANAINLPYGMEFNAVGLSDKFERMAQALQVQQTGSHAVVAHLVNINQTIGIPARLSDIGVQEADLDLLADLAFADFAHPNNPKPVEREDFKMLYQKAL